MSNDQIFPHDLDHNDETWIVAESASREVVPALTDTGFVTLALLSKLIIRDLYALHSVISVADPSYNQTFDLDIAQSVLTPHNLKRFTTTYFRLAHLYIPVVHMPSFGTDETSSSLALAVALFGAAMSPPSDDALSAKGFLRLAEEYIFRNLAGAVRGGSVPERQELEVMQAALLVLNVHFLMNDTEARRRNRTRRLPALVLAVRHFGLYQTRHSPEASLSQFVRNEHRIRTATWITLADWHQSVMFNALPVTAISEVQCDLPCPRKLWDKKDATIEDVEVYRQQKQRSPRCLESLKDLVETLMGEPWDGIDSFPVNAITMSGLELAIFAISSIATSAHLMSLMPTSAPGLLRAISRWRELWEAVAAQRDHETLQMTAMARYCGEFCCLVQKIVEASGSGKDLPPYLEAAAHDSVAEIHSFIFDSS
ncbi:hypothetical protein CONLIGDRAFT_569909 [Coniochaeta ligniaria NRRL 30616]|uniref:Xylanolytic transcriptional activator regulatory domain-containing protein n=1 Tax=Coniochaeta ligniaria NRRL 30616 TaxID=1408157 RepID=A0A1J7JHL0_9PEZI|nr:hypothetical protein CONLIGDRAFT_569909 [Coniochaeta ligniaria NRRL 30616]